MVSDGWEREYGLGGVRKMGDPQELDGWFPWENPSMNGWELGKRKPPHGGSLKLDGFIPRTPWTSWSYRSLDHPISSYIPVLRDVDVFVDINGTKWYYKYPIDIHLDVEDFLSNGWFIHGKNHVFWIKLEVYPIISHKMWRFYPIDSVMNIP